MRRFRLFFGWERLLYWSCLSCAGASASRFGSVDMGDKTSHVARLAEDLVKRQNTDGGWGYSQGSSWTEPTSLAVLALQATGAFETERIRAREWLRRAQREDGGWPPQPGIAHSTWATAAVLLVPEMLHAARYTKAIDWLMNRTGRESTLVERVRRYLLGMSSEVGEGTNGWPWFPDTAGWVTPTAFSILALQKAAADQPRVASRISEGKEFLFARICADGGWNHGGAKALGQTAASYTDTTGQALLALRGVPDARLGTAIAFAQLQLKGLKSAEGVSWLRLGIQAHGVEPAEPEGPLVCRTTNALALRILANAARRTNAFV
jgi:Squalene-hopene cyclase C-terminal domain